MPRQHIWSEPAITTVLADPEVQRLRELIDQEVQRAGRELRDDLQVFADRHDQAVRDGDLGTFVWIIVRTR